jgi:hypothetical protein
MGCGPTAARPERRVRPQNRPDGATRDRPGQAATVPTSPPACFEFITSGARNIAGVANMMPVVCLSRDSFPIITYAQSPDDFALAEGSPQLPIVAGSVVGSGRVLCFAQLQLLYVRHFSEEGNRKLLTNSLRWLSGSSTSMVQIVALDFEKTSQQPIRSSLQEMGYDAEFVARKHFTTSGKSFHVLLLPSDLDLSNDDFLNEILAFARGGGGVGVFFNSLELLGPTIPVNRLLIQFHLAYTLFLLDEGAEPAALIPIPESYAQIRDVNLIPLLARFKATVKQSCVDDEALEDVVTSLRFYVTVCDDSHGDELEQVSDYCWDFLRRTEYSTPAGVCPEVSHGLAALMLYDLSLRLPPAKVTPFPEHAAFPGATGDAPPGPPEVAVQMALDAWMPTGLWLPAGVVGAIDCDGPARCGCRPHRPHGPHPDVGACAEETPPTFTMRLLGFVMYPRNDAGNPEVWEQTKDCDVPWGEIVPAG